MKKELAAYSYPAERIEVVHASEVIETGEPPVLSLIHILVISHIVLFDSHESSGMISLGIAIASISTDLDLFYIFIQL